MGKNYTSAIVIACLCSFLFATTARSQTISQLSFYSPLISTFDMKYTNNHLVVSQNGLLIFDVTNPNNKPKLIAQTTYPGSIAYAVSVQNNNAFMAFGSNGIFAVYDISDFSKPTIIGSVAISALSFYGVGDIAPHGNYVYLSGFDSLYVVDISNPSTPVIANAIPITHTQFSGASNMAIESNTLFVRTPFSVHAYDITNATNPLLTDSIANTHAYNEGMAVDTINHRLFLPWLSALRDTLGFDAYSVASPVQLQHLFSDSTTFSSPDFGVSDYSYFSNTLFLNRSGGINAFDVSDSAHHFVTTFSGEDIPNSSVSIQVRDSILFNARGGGIEVLKYADAQSQQVCAEPDGLRENVAGTTAALRWNKKPLSKGYLLRYRRLSTNDWNYIPSKDNFVKVTNLIPGKGYTWEVKSICGITLKETSDWSLYNIFFVSNTAGNSLITVSPNPVQNSVHVHVSDASVKQVVITDVSSKPLIRSNVTDTDFNVITSALTTGTYFVQALDKNNRVIALAKVFKQ